MMDMQLIYTMIRVADNCESNIKSKLERINEIDATILKLLQEKKSIAIHVDHECDLLDKLIEEYLYKDNVVEDVIEKHKSLIKVSKDIANNIITSK